MPMMMSILATRRFFASIQAHIYTQWSVQSSTPSGPIDPEAPWTGRMGPAGLAGGGHSTTRAENGLCM